MSGVRYLQAQLADFKRRAGMVIRSLENVDSKKHVRVMRAFEELELALKDLGRDNEED